MLLATLLLLQIGTYSFNMVYAQPLKYRILVENVTLFVEKDTTCILVYNLTVKVDEGAIKNYVSIGMPNRYFNVVEAKELDTGESIKFTEHREDGNFYVELKVSRAIKAGETRVFWLVVEVKNLVFKDETNPGNAGLQFIPSWFPVKVEKLTLTIVLPEGVKANEVKNTPDYDNIMNISGRVALYWERHGLAPNEKLKVGVSFPAKYLTATPLEPGEKGFWDTMLDSILASLPDIIFVALIMVSSYYIYKTQRKMEYEEPRLMVEALGPRKGLYAPEAAWLIESHKRRPDYGKILTMILYSLIRKGVVEVVSVNPLKLRKIGDGGRLRYYERGFLECIEEDGGLREECLVKVIDSLDKGVAEKIRGYSRRETIRYYRRIVDRAWREVIKAETPLLKVRTAEEKLDWLMMDPEYRRKLPRILSYNYPVYIDNLTVWNRTLPVETREGFKAKPPNIIDLTDAVAKNIEQTAVNIVGNVEKFAEQVASTIEGRTGRQTDGRGRPVFSSSCACVSCACACACVSCACACASGGAG